jgi:hypothetical protein
MKKYTLHRTWFNKAIATAVAIKSIWQIAKVEPMLNALEKLFNGYQHEWQILAGYSLYALSIVGLAALAMMCTWWVLGDKSWWTTWK